MSINGKRVVVIGGTSGIGLAVAEQAVKQGAEIVIASSDQSRVEEAAAKLAAAGQVRGIRVDATDEASIRSLFDEVGAFDHLVYTAGEALLLKPITEVSAEEARAFFERRYWGAFLAAKHAAAHLRPGGSIVLTSGGVATRPAPGTSVPASTTGAVESLTRALALDLAPIRVNAVRPGVIRTELWDGTVPEPQPFLDAVAGTLPVQHVGTPEEIAQTYLYLLNNTYSTGTVVVADGGQALV